LIFLNKQIANIDDIPKKERQFHQLAGRATITKVKDLTGYSQEVLPPMLVEYVNAHLPIESRISPLTLQKLKIEGVLHVYNSLYCNVKDAAHIREEDRDENSDYKRCVASSNYCGSSRFDDVEMKEEDGKFDFAHTFLLLYLLINFFQR
jgi:hypothetical protein